MLMVVLGSLDEEEEGYSATRINMGTSAHRRALDRLFVSSGMYIENCICFARISVTINFNTNDNNLKVFTYLNEKFSQNILFY